MTEDQENTQNLPPTHTPHKENPYGNMAEKIAETLPQTLPATADDLRVLDPATILGRQMLVLDDLFEETLTRYTARKDVPYSNARGACLPLLLRIQQNCQCTARTIANIDYIDHLQRQKATAPAPTPLKKGKQTEFNDA
jgi:hypothetical protein